MWSSRFTIVEITSGSGAVEKRSGALDLSTNNGDNQKSGSVLFRSGISNHKSGAVDIAAQSNVVVKTGTAAKSGAIDMKTGSHGSATFLSGNGVNTGSIKISTSGGGTVLVHSGDSQDMSGSTKLVTRETLSDVGNSGGIQIGAGKSI